MKFILKKIREKTSYKNPKDRTEAILTALLLFPIAYVIYERSQIDSFLMGVATGAFILGLTLCVIQFWILDYFVEVRAFKTLSSSLNRSCKLISPHNQSIGRHLNEVFDYSTKSFDDRWKDRHAFAANQRPVDLNLVISDTECDKAMRNLSELTNQRIGEPTRFYLGLVTEIKRLQPVVLAASFHLNPDYYSGSGAGTVSPAAYWGSAVGSTFTSLMLSQSDLDNITYELENLELILMNDKMIDSHNDIRIRLNIKVKHFYHTVIIYKHLLNHLNRLNGDILNGSFLTSVRRGQQYLV